VTAVVVSTRFRGDVVTILLAALVLLFGASAFADNAPTKPHVTTGDRVVSDDTMREDRFWALIARTTAYEADPERQLEALRQALRELSPPEIEAFERAFHREQRRAYTWKLWGAAYVLNGGASDDGFEYFQRWLISKGRRTFEAAVSDPDSLADMVAPGAQGTFEFEEFAYVAGRVWAEKTGIDPSKETTGFPYTGAAPAARPSGTPFKDDANYLAKTYPKLWARFGTAPSR